MLWPSGRRCGCETGLGSIAALLGKNPGKVPAYDASPLNAGVFFDIEADRVWRKFSDQPLGADRLLVLSGRCPLVGLKSKRFIAQYPYANGQLRSLK